MYLTDFFTDPVEVADPWGGAPTAGKAKFRLDLMNDLRRGPVAGWADLEVASALAELLHNEFQSYGTDGGQSLTDSQVAAAVTALVAVLKRVGVDFGLPFRNFTGFRSHWTRNDGYGSWQARRDILHDLFDPLHNKLTLMENRTLTALAEPVSPQKATGWPMVDEEIRELQRRFQVSSTPQDYRAIGGHCVGVLEALSRTVYDPTKHLYEGETEPTPDKTKQRLGRYVEVALPGASNVELRGLVTKAIEFAQRVKHDHTPTRREAGIAADSMILLANILKRLEQEI